MCLEEPSLDQMRLARIMAGSPAVYSFSGAESAAAATIPPRAQQMISCFFGAGNIEEALLAGGDEDDSWTVRVYGDSEFTFCDIMGWFGDELEGAGLIWHDRSEMPTQIYERTQHYLDPTAIEYKYPIGLFEDAEADNPDSPSISAENILLLQRRVSSSCGGICAHTCATH